MLYVLITTYYLRPEVQADKGNYTQFPCLFAPNEAQIAPNETRVPNETHVPNETQFAPKKVNFDFKKSTLIFKRSTLIYKRSTLI